ncbi:hypothetical protein WJX74_009307 [Apatococcus lobatus]|uniref:Uncharacterized protein n=1 Tax=Apatococcus lobatus TaxID=904363 RepID=A0AAW1R108_9CHLO
MRSVLDGNPGEDMAPQDALFVRAMMLETTTALDMDQHRNLLRHFQGVWCHPSGQADNATGPSLKEAIRPAEERVLLAKELCIGVSIRSAPD